MFKKLLVPSLLLVVAVQSSFGQGTPLSTTSVDWFNSATTLLRDLNGVALTQGTANVNTDGDLVQLGYFSAGTAANNFAGNWIPLTGSGATLHTSIGDSPDLSGLGAGRIGFSTTFTFGTNQVKVYDAGNFDTGAYATQSSISITSNGGVGSPPTGQVLAIRFFDTTAGTSGHYNTVSNDNWVWASPTEAGGGAILSPINLGQNGITLEWEDPANTFRTSLFVVAIPEPSTYASAMVGFGLLGLAAMRRRVKG